MLDFGATLPQIKQSLYTLIIFASSDLTLIYPAQQMEKRENNLLRTLDKGSGDLVQSFQCKVSFTSRTGLK